jgi:hypothetical protein
MSDPSIIGTLITITQSNITALGTLGSFRVSGLATFNNIQSNGTATLFSSSSIPINQNSLNQMKIGFSAGNVLRQTNAISIGTNAGVSGQGTNSISIGNQAGRITQGENTIAIGLTTGSTNQGSGSIAIGSLAGSQQASNSIILSALGTVVTGSTSNATFIAPIRNFTQNNILGYDTSNYEMSYYLSPPSPYSFQRYRNVLTANQTMTFNVNNIIKWNGSEINNITSLTNNSTTGIISLGSTGLYFFSISINYSSNSNGLKQYWIANSIDAGVPIDGTSYATGRRSFFSQTISTLQRMSTSFFSLRVQITDTLPITLGVGFYQNSNSPSASLFGTTSASTVPTNLIIYRMIF